MKKLNNIIFYLFAFLLAANLVSCDSAGDEEFGVSLLYMPQAVNSTNSADGGTNNYTIEVSPNSKDSAITVGVYRSGLEKLGAYSVDLKIDIDSLNIAIAKGLGGEEGYEVYKNVELLPTHYYTLADKISVADGHRDGYVHLTLNKTELLNNWTDPAKKYILPVRVVNPSRYKLNNDLSLTMFILSKKN